MQEFNDAALSDWPVKNDDNAQYVLENGELSIRGKKSYYAWKEFSGLDQSSDFQMEIRVKFDFSAVTGSDAYMGIVWGVENNRFNYVALFNSDNHTMQIGDFDSTNYNNQSSKASASG